MDYLPLWCGVGCAMLMVLARILTNRYVVRHGAQNSGTTSVVGHIPPILSVLYLLAFVGMAVTLIWSLIVVGWWAALIIFVAYLLTSRVRSVLVGR